MESGEFGAGRPIIRVDRIELGQHRGLAQCKARTECYCESLAMSLHVVEMDLSPNPALLANNIAERPGAVWLWSNIGVARAYLACDPIDQVAQLDPEPGLQLDPGSGSSGYLPRWIGVLPYEAFRNLERPNRAREPDLRALPFATEPCWWRYGAVAEITDRVRVIGDRIECVESLARYLAENSQKPRVQDFRLEPQTLESSDHASRIRAALRHIQNGDIYQINLARRFDFRVQGHALNWLQTLGENAPAPFCFALQTAYLRVAGTSPELCLSLAPDGRLVTRPIKGTRPRASSPPQDARLIESLESDPKEIAELSMVIDLERNDLCRVSKGGSVEVLHAGAVETYGPVHQRVATLAARLKPGVSRTDLLRAFLPSSSVTGAPKIRAMELIAALEPERRGLYTGVYGWLGHNGSLRFAMAIRTLVANGSNQGHYFAGGGIVADSKCEQEVEETVWKSTQILSISARPVTDPNPEKRVATSATDWFEDWFFGT